MGLDGSGPVEQVFDFPTLSLGFQHPQDQRQIGAGGFFDMNNLMPGQGGLRRRPGLQTSSAFLTGITWAGFGATPTALNERVVNLFQYPSAAGVSNFVLVTTRAMYHRNTANTWKDVTPITTGTCNITNGTKALAGIGTAWVNTEAVTTNMLVLLSGTWYSIASVNSDTSITLVANYTGATLAGGAFQIKRCWDLAGSIGLARAYGRVFSVVLNGDVYICGLIGTDLNPTIVATAIQAGAVLKLPQAATYNVTMGTATVLASGIKATGPGATAALGYTWFPAGFDSLDDGRLIIPIYSWVQSAAAQGTARLAYSSHLNVAVWTVTPAGFTDVQKAGNMSAMCRLGKSRAIHFDTGVVLAEPTGQADPPLSFTDTRARVGAVGPHATIDIPDAGGQVYVGDDLNLRVFDGNSDHVLSPNFQRLLVMKEAFFTGNPIVGLPDQQAVRGRMRAAQAVYLPHRQQYLFLYTFDYGIPAASYGSRSIIAVYDVARGLCYYWTVGSEVSMIGTGWTGIDAPGTVTQLFGESMEFVYGAPTITDQGAANSNAVGIGNPFLYSDTLPSTFGAVTNDGNAGACFFVTDALDMGAPGVIMAITRVEVIGEAIAGQAAGGFFSADVYSPTNSLLIAGAATSPAAFNNGSNAIHFTYSPLSTYDSYRIRVAVVDLDANRVGALMNYKFLKLRVWWVPTLDTRAR